MTPRELHAAPEHHLAVLKHITEQPALPELDARRFLLLLLAMPETDDATAGTTSPITHITVSFRHASSASRAGPACPVGSTPARTAQRPPPSLSERPPRRTRHPARSRARRPSCGVLNFTRLSCSYRANPSARAPRRRVTVTVSSPIAHGSTCMPGNAVAIRAASVNLSAKGNVVAAEWLTGDARRRGGRCDDARLWRPSLLVGDRLDVDEQRGSCSSRCGGGERGRRRSLTPRCGCRRRTASGRSDCDPPNDAGYLTSYLLHRRLARRNSLRSSRPSQSYRRPQRKSWCNVSPARLNQTRICTCS